MYFCTQLAHLAGQFYPDERGLREALVDGYSQITLEEAFTLDPEQNRSEEKRDGYSLNLGVGATYAIAGGAGIVLEIRDVALFEYDRDWFDLSDPLLAEPRVPEPAGEPPAKQSTIHNLRFSVGFTYVPGAGR